MPFRRVASRDAPSGGNAVTRERTDHGASLPLRLTVRRLTSGTVAGAAMQRPCPAYFPVRNA